MDIHARPKKDNEFITPGTLLRNGGGCSDEPVVVTLQPAHPVGPPPVPIYVSSAEYHEGPGSYGEVHGEEYHKGLGRYGEVALLCFSISFYIILYDTILSYTIVYYSIL